MVGEIEYGCLQTSFNFMFGLMILLFIGFLIICPFLVIGFKIYNYQKRSVDKTRNFAGMQSVLRVAGWNVVGNKPPSYIPNHHAYALFARGKEKMLFGAAYKQINDETAFTFQYSYKISYSNGGSHTFRQTVVGFQSRRLNLPYFTLYPEPPLGFLGEALGGPKDIDFPANPVFSNRYALNSHDEGNVRFIFNSQVVSFFENIPVTLYVDGGGQFLFVYVQDKLVPPEQLTAWVNDVSKILHLFQR
jgi:hypothetical protein